MKKLWINYLHPCPRGEYNDSNDMQYLQTTKIIRTGNSLCIVLPKNILTGAGLARGDQVAFGIAGPNTLAIYRLTREQVEGLLGNKK